MKESHPVETPEFPCARDVDNEAAFAWWVAYTLCKHDVILSAVRSRLRKTTHKYGIEIPKDVNHAMELDCKNGNMMWKDALAKEMFNIGVAFEVLEHGQKVPAGWSMVTGHLVWDIKDGLYAKGNVGPGQPQDARPSQVNICWGMLRDSVRIAFTYAASHGLDIFTADIHNAYLQALLSQWDNRILPKSKILLVLYSCE